MTHNTVPLLSSFVTAALCLALAGRASEARALGFGCAGVAGEVLFLDTLYGTGTGLVGAGIVEALRDTHGDWPKRFATGAAMGAGLGLVLGGLEIGLRDCSEPTRVRHTRVEPGWQAPGLVFVPGKASGSEKGATGLRFAFLLR